MLLSKGDCSQISKPLPRMMRSKISPGTESFSTERTQSAEGLLAERHFMARMAKLNAAKQAQEAERQAQQEQWQQEQFRQREQARQRALVFANAGRGIIPPDPSLNSQDGGSRRPSEASRTGASLHISEASRTASRAGTEEVYVAADSASAA